MFISETITITNNGNATASYWWSYNTNGGLFVPSPLEDQVEPKQTKTAKVIFTPNGPKPDDETLLLKIKNGNPIDIVCKGNVNEAGCIF